MSKKQLLAKSKVEMSIRHHSEAFGLLDSRLVEDTLVIDLYSRHRTEKTSYELICSVFIELIDGKVSIESEFTTRHYSDKKWRNGKIECYIGPVMHRVNSWCYGVSDEQKERFLQPVNDDALKLLEQTCGKQVERAWDAWLMINNLQAKIKENALMTRYKREIAHFEEVNAQTPELPKAVEKWIRTVLMPGYIIYDYDTRQAYCSSCKNVVNVERWVKRNDEIYCPNCGRLSVTLPSRQYHINDWQTFVVAQKLKNGGMVLRRFEASRHWSRGSDAQQPRSVRVSEYSRCFISENGDYEYYEKGIYKQSNIYTWCKMDTVDYAKFGSSRFYMDSFKHLEGTKFYWLMLRGEVTSVDWQRFLTEQPLPYFSQGVRYPAIESLARKHKYKFLAELLRNPEEYIVKNVPCDFRALGIPKYHFDEIVEKDYRDCWGHNFQTIRRVYQMYGHINSDTIKFIKQTDASFDVVTTMLGPEGKCMKGIRYINNLRLKEAGHTLRDYEDYLRMCRELNIRLTKQVMYPQDFRKAHDEVTRIVNEKKLAVDNAKYVKKRDELVKVFKSYANEKFLVRLPATASEIQQEGLQLGHCVATYIPRVLSGETVILLVRNKDRSDDPFYTLEVKNFKVIQCRTKNNMTAPPEILKFCEEYVKKVMADNKKLKKSA